MPLADPCTNTCETNSAVLVFIYTKTKGVCVSYLLCDVEKRKSIRALLRFWKAFTGVEPKKNWNCLKLCIQQKDEICFILNSQPGQQFQQHRHRVAPVPRICPVGRMETPAQTDLSPLLHYFKNCWKIIFSEKSENTYQASEVSPALDYLFIAQSSKLLNFNPNLHMRQLRMKSWVIYQRVARKPSGSGGLSLEMPSFLH